jgi:hypothetical protein
MITTTKPKFAFRPSNSQLSGETIFMNGGPGSGRKPGLYGDSDFHKQAIIDHLESANEAPTQAGKDAHLASAKAHELGTKASHLRAARLHGRAADDPKTQDKDSSAYLHGDYEVSHHQFAQHLK